MYVPHILLQVHQLHQAQNARFKNNCQ